MNGAIYAIVCLATGAMYIGSATCLKRRWRTHRRELRTGIQQDWLDAKRPALNICFDARAGMTGRHHSEATKLKIGSRVVSEETREKLRASMIGNKRCLGARRSKETKAKMRAAVYARLGKAA